MVLCRSLPAACSPVSENVVADDEGFGGDDPFNAPATSGGDADADVAEDDEGFGFADDGFGGGGGDEAAAGAFEDAPAAAPGAPAEPQESAQLVFARKFRAVVQERDAEEQAKREERTQRADGELDQWRSMRSEHREKTATSNRDSERELIESQAEEKATSNSWAQVVKIIDTQATSEEGKTDAARMRSVLIQLKSNPLKPPISAAEPTAAQ
jgi:hypothetical protein